MPKLRGPYLGVVTVLGVCLGVWRPYARNFLASMISVEDEHVLIKHGLRRLVHISSLHDGPATANGAMD